MERHLAQRHAAPQNMGGGFNWLRWMRKPWPPHP